MGPTGGFIQKTGALQNGTFAVAASGQGLTYNLYTVTQESVVKNLMAQIFISRDFAYKGLVLIVSGKDDEITAMQSADWSTATPYKEYEDYIWGRMHFFGGSSSAIQSKQTRLELKTSTSRRVKVGDQFGILVILKDVEAQAGNARVSSTVEYQEKSLE